MYSAKCRVVGKPIGGCFSPPNSLLLTPQRSLAASRWTNAATRRVRASSMGGVSLS